MVLIREDRDPTFWTEIASHPEVRKTLYGHPPELVGELMRRPDVRHFASTHGGWAFWRLDSYGLVWDCHAMFTPDGWGREAHVVMKYAFRALFETAHAILVSETDSPRSRPPLSCGFKPCGATTETVAGPLTTWVLTRSAWEASPAYRRA
jgi:hypothetical protein